MTPNLRQPADHEARLQATEGIDRDLFLDAGAGAGKTSLLVNHYLHILEATPSLSPHDIIAATFTKKAAGEMKERLRGKCRELAAHENGDRWRRAARELETAPIDTIHGLCSRFLHDSAIAAGLDPGFGVIEGPEQALLLEKCVRRCLLSRLDANVSTAAEIVADRRLDGACTTVVSLIDQRARYGWLWQEGSVHLDAEALWKSWCDALPQQQGEALSELVASPEWADATSELENCTGADPKDKLEQIRLGILGRVRQIEDVTKTIAERFELLPHLGKGSTNAGQKGLWPSEEALARAKACIKQFTNSAEGLVRQRVDEVRKLELLPEHERLASLTAALMAETAAAAQAYEEAKQDLAVLDFTDLQIRVSELWDRRPEILAQYQSRIRHVLLDEFQDTDDLQMKILWPLADRGAHRFVVGDVKQSIYRFRNADVTVFNRTRDRMTEADPRSLERLTVNFRSRPALIAFFNDLFSHDAVMGSERKEEYEAFYEPLTSHREVPEEQAVEFHFLVGDKDSADGSGSLAERMRTLEAERLARRLRDAVEQGELLVATPGDDGTEVARPVRYGDCAVLFRATTDLGIYEQALRDQHVPYHVLSGRGFFRRQEVQDVLNCLRAVENGQDEVALVGTLRGPLFALSDETLFWLSRLPGGWWERLQMAGAGIATHGSEVDWRPPLSHLSEAEGRKVVFAADSLQRLRTLKNRLRLSQLISEVLETTGLSATLAGLFNGPQMVSNLRKLAEIAAQYERSGDYSLRDFVAYLNEMDLREERESDAPVAEEGSDVVKLLTIHSAKGLEWPVVIVPDLARKSTHNQLPGAITLRLHPKLGLVARGHRDEKVEWPPQAQLLQRRNEDEDLAELRRLYYVAYTRARDHLILSAGIADKSRDKAKDPVAWICDALGIRLDEPTDSVITGPGWQGRLQILQPLGETEATSSPEASSPSPEEPAKTAAPPVTDLRPVLARCRQLEPDHAAKHRFHATELTTYSLCPRRYALRYLLGVPEEAPCAPSFAPDEALSPIELGEIVHRLLRIVGSGGKDRLETVLAEGLALDAPLARRARLSMDHLRGLVERYLESDLYADLVAPAQRLRTEMTLLFSVPDPPVLFEGKVDALVEDAQGHLHLLDFKTGRHNPEAESEHRLQLGLYCAAVQSVGTGNLDSATIVYLSDAGLQLAKCDPVATAREALDRGLEAVRGIRRGSFGKVSDDRCTLCRLRWACEGRELV
ncbi:UvrD-helicase domain-containing protein [bacterium]|nr:UvrD-helicase domain-containing protein [bacterium]